MLILARLILRYEPNPPDLVRLDGHARNLALFALLLALARRLTDLPHARWRYAAGAVLAVLVTWPTVAEPVRNLGLAIGQGIEVANAGTVERERHERFGSRYRLFRFVSDGIATYVRDHTAVDARVLSPHPAEISAVTGRSNASGFAQLLHLRPQQGPSYRDAIQYLEPAALRRLGIDYVHAPDAWVAELPDRAARWLADPGLFDLLIRNGAAALYRVRPEFLRLDVPRRPPRSRRYGRLYRRLPRYILPPRMSRWGVSARRPSCRTPGCWVSWMTGRYTRNCITVGPPSTRGGRGLINPGPLHLLTPWPVEPLGERVPDIVVLPRPSVPWRLPPAARQPIWWNDAVAVYAPGGAVAPIMPPPRPPEDPLDVDVQVSDVRVGDGRVTFTTTMDDRAPEQWTGQDWVVIAVDRSPWALPREFQPDGRAPVIVQWFAGQVVPGRGTTTYVYEFDAGASRLVVRDEQGTLTAVASTDSALGAGTWMLGIRLQHQWRPNSWREAAFIPVLLIEVSEAGEVSYQVYDDPGTGRALP